MYDLTPLGDLKSSLGRRWAGNLILSLSIALACFAVLFCSYATASQSGFCRPGVMPDYEGSLENLVSHRPLRERTKLPFGPKGLEVRRLDVRRFVVNGDRFGYALTAKGATTEAGLLKRPLHLHWKVEVTLSAVNANGRATGPAVRSWRRLGDVADLRRLEFAASPGPGLYRLGLNFERWNGDSLGSYSEYFRVVPFRVGLDLALSRSTAFPGEEVLARVRNVGTDTALFPNDVDLRVEYDKDGSWVGIPTPKADGAVIGISRFLYGGEATPCSSFRIPEEAEPGRYRFSVMARPFGGLPSRLLVGEFSVPG